MAWEKAASTNPTLTHVPPSLLPSMTIALAPYRALAARAAPRPPLPPPITRKSVSLEMGAMASEVAEKWRDRVLIRPVAVAEERRGRLAKRNTDCMEDGYRVYGEERGTKEGIAGSEGLLYKKEGDKSNWSKQRALSGVTNCAIEARNSWGEGMEHRFQILITILDESAGKGDRKERVAH